MCLCAIARKAREKWPESGKVAGAPMTVGCTNATRGHGGADATAPCPRDEIAAGEDALTAHSVEIPYRVAQNSQLRHLARTEQKNRGNDMPSLQRCIIRSRRVLVYILRALLMLNATRLSCARNDAQPSFQGGAHTHEFRSFSVCGDSGIRAKSLNTAGPWTIDFGGCSFSGNTHGAPLVRAGSCPDQAGCLDLSYNSITLVPSNAFQGMGNMT
jgi:hypothetical protein